MVNINCIKSTVTRRLIVIHYTDINCAADVTGQLIALVRIIIARLGNRQHIRVRRIIRRVGKDEVIILTVGSVVRLDIESHCTTASHVDCPFMVQERTAELQQKKDEQQRRDY